MVAPLGPILPKTAQPRYDRFQTTQMIRAGIQDWWFCARRNCAASNRAPSFGGPLWTRTFLERWTRDWQKGVALRRVLIEAGRGRAVDALTNVEVIEQVALLIERGEIHIHASEAWVHVVEDVSDGRPDAPPPSPAFPLAARSAAQPDSNPQPASDDPSTFASPVDTGAQIAALMSAAQQGAPFCPE